MGLEDYEGGTVVLTWTETIEYSLEDDFKAVAKILGITQKKLAGYLDDSDWPSPDDLTDAARKRLRKHGDAQSETVDVDSLEAT
jgi:hypothetical protein